ncbi:MAG: glycoside hydrolase family 3 N-terminal domain-containing protein [Tenacibaculum sp.]
MNKKILLFFALLTCSMQAQEVYPDPLVAKDSTAQKIWVDSILRSMTIDEKIGQLFMIQAYSNRDEQHRDYISQMINKYHIGNLVFMQGTPEKQLALSNLYQSKAKVPLLIGFDGEWGLDMRLKNTYRFPWNMTLGAISDNRLIEETGKRIGQHCKRIGIHINFAPVVDINTSPDNPIIGNRSFGENKENVSQKAFAFAKGMQSVGVLASAKHFPGHGNTSTDSHKMLPTINFSEEQLLNNELYPYKEIFKSKIASVMIAHLSIPQLEPDVNLPSSLSKKIATDLLQTKLGFKGLVITDGLNMKGATNYSTPAEVNLAAFLAGNDILLIPQKTPETIKLIKQALDEGKLTENRIDFSVQKILKAKYLAGLNNYKPLSNKNLQKDLHKTQDKLLHRKLIKNAITLIKDDTLNLPIKNLKNKKIAYVSLGDDSGDDFFNMLKNYTKITKVNTKHLSNLLSELKKYNTVIVGYHKSNKHPWKSYKFNNKELVWLHEIARSTNTILCVMASPYSLLQVESTNIESLVVSYQNSKISQELTAQALFGAIEIKGKLPVSIKNFKAGYGLSTAKLNVLKYTIPEEAGVSSVKLQQINKRIDTILMKKMTPGGQILAARNGKVFFSKSFGYHTFKKKRKVVNSDLYDLASLTKILASLPVLMKAEEEQKLSIYSSIGSLLPKYNKSNKDTLLLKEILSHKARLKPWIPFYLHTKDKQTGKNSSKYYRKKWSKEFSIKVAENLFLTKKYKDTIFYKIAESEQRSNPEYKYSDLGYYMIKEILEKKYNQRLDILANQMFYKSLGANRTTYIPLNKFKKSEVVPTEIDNYYRHQTVHGFVHDMGAAMLGGVGGHAGLFANANDIAKIMQMYLQKGNYGGIEYFSPQTIDKFNTRYYAHKKVRRGLGFDKPQITISEQPTCGCVSNMSFGHSGFTGTYAWADPESGILYVFLSNRTYPSMSNDGLIKSNMRTKIQSDIQNAILHDKSSRDINLIIEQ